MDVNERSFHVNGLMMYQYNKSAVLTLPFGSSPWNGELFD